MKTNNGVVPNIFFIDIDGTMIGNIHPQVCEWEIVQRYGKGKMPQLRKNIMKQLENGILRPDFANFIDFLKNRYDDCHIYIYTASETKWAHFIVSCIEQLTQLKFDRPIFTRSHCSVVNKEYRKSIEHVMPIVYKTLSGTNVYGPNIASIKDVKANAVLIDNNHVLTEANRLVFCPTYEFVDCYDVIRLVNEDVLADNYVEISTMLASYDYFPIIPDAKQFSYQVFKALYFTLIGSNIKDSVKNAKHGHSKDNFWNKLGHEMHKIEYNNLKDSVIKTLNHRI
jgi:hypothetical protein